MSIDPVQAGEYRKVACRLAEIGGQTARRYLGKVSATRKADNTPVTQADHHTQDIILGELALRFPMHGILVEETVARPRLHTPIAESDFCWVVDPIDGTRNFSRGVGVYATSVALLHRGQPIAGAIFDATTQWVYSAALGAGAWCGNDPLDRLGRPAADDTTIAISSLRGRKAPPVLMTWLETFLFRNHGAVALHLAWVAAGLVDAAFSLECKVWDIAAACLLVEEAGGVVTGPDGKALWPMDLVSYQNQDIPVLAAPAMLHAKLLETYVTFS